MNKHKYQDALIELTRSVDLNPKEPTPHYQLARVYDRLGRPEKAEAERAIHGKLTAVASQANRP
jgi:Flp pilus assembly protein TadD